MASCAKRFRFEQHVELSAIAGAGQAIGECGALPKVIDLGVDVVSGQILEYPVADCEFVSGSMSK